MVRFSIRRMLAAVFVFAICFWLSVNLIENNSLKRRLVELQSLNHRLVLESNRLAGYQVEFQHFETLAKAKIESVDVVLDAQRRKSSTEIEVEDIKHRIDQLLNVKTEANPCQRKAKIMRSEIARCERLLKQHQNSANPSSQQIAQIKRQIAYFTTQSENYSK